MGVSVVAAFAGGVSGVIDESRALPASIRAAHGQGTMGVAVATSENCSSGPSGSCSWTGDFTSKDGRIRFKHVDLSGGAWKVGRPADALYEGRSLFGVLIYHAHGSHRWVDDAMTLVGSSFLLIPSLILLPIAIASGIRRKGRRSDTDRRPGRHRAETADPGTFQHVNAPGLAESPLGEDQSS